MSNKDLQNFYQVMEIEDWRNFKMPLLAIDEPIFGVVSYLDRIYTVYIMQDRTLLKNNHLVDIKELLITEPNINDLCNVIDGEISIYNFFEKSDKYSIGKIANKIFPIMQVNSMIEISEKLPSNDFRLTLNQVCANDYKLYIRSRCERLKEYNDFNDSFTLKKFKNVEIKKQIESLNKLWEVENEIYSNR